MKKCWPWAHDWKRTGFHHVTNYVSVVRDPGELPVGYETEVFFECVKCAHPKTVIVKGKWKP